MTKKSINMSLVGQWTLIIVGLVGIAMRLEHRMTTLEVLQETTAARVLVIDDRVEKMYSMVSKTIIANEGK